MLKIENLTVSVNDKIILKDFNLDIDDHEIVALMGPNGVGKSTICKVLMGNDDYKIESGSITFNGEDLTKMSIDERSKKGIFYLSQNPIEIEGVTNAEMLRSALECRTGEYINFFEFNKRITEVCKKLNIPESFIHRGINESMSGGERKKNELMHLYMLTPSLVILDELDSGLDVDSLKSISDALNEYFENKVSYLIVTHHISILEYLNPTKVCVLKNGSIVKTGDYELAKSIEKNGFSTYGVSEEN